MLNGMGPLFFAPSICCTLLDNSYPQRPTRVSGNAGEIEFVLRRHLC
jgi:hypothetical protein